MNHPPRVVARARSSPATKLSPLPPVCPLASACCGMRVARSAARATETQRKVVRTGLHRLTLDGLRRASSSRLCKDTGEYRWEVRENSDCRGQYQLTRQMAVSTLHGTVLKVQCEAFIDAELSTAFFGNTTSIAPPSRRPAEHCTPSCRYSLPSPGIRGRSGNAAG